MIPRAIDRKIMPIVNIKLKSYCNRSLLDIMDGNVFYSNVQSLMVTCHLSTPVEPKRPVYRVHFIVGAAKLTIKTKFFANTM